MSFISYAQNFEDVMLWRALKHVDKGFYIDVGANDPEDDSVTKAFYDRGWQGINIEPEKRFFEKLQVQRSRDINLNVAVSDQKEPIEIYMFEKRGWSTGDSEVALAHKNSGESYRIEKINTQSLDTICFEHNVHEIHFLKIDVEGAEKSVLQSFSFRSVRPWIVVIEATQPNTNIDISSEWEEILLDGQYYLAYFDGINKFYVSKEHKELLRAFTVPPNILDNFIRVSQYKAETNLKLCLEEKENITYKLAAEDEELLQQKQTLQQIQTAHEKILHSNSWKITYPLRLASQWLHELKKKHDHGPHDKKQFLLDLSQVYFQDDSTGIQRVIHQLRKEIGTLLPNEYNLMPVYATSKENYRYTAKFGPDHTRLKEQDEQLVTVHRGDIFLGLDLSAHLFPMIEETLLSYRQQGVSVNFIVYDIIPLLYPQYTTEGIAHHFRHWIQGITQCADRIFCISESVADDVKRYIHSHFETNTSFPDIQYFTLGANLEKNQHLPPLRKEIHETLDILKEKKTFLMVGTLEPRKAHAQVLEAFEDLWKEGSDVVLLFVGKAGWNTEPLIERIEKHSYLHKQFFWIKDANDSELIESFKSSTCFIMASYTEGFGLPIIEAAYYSVPIIARDISVFHEVAKESAFYFNDENKADTLKNAIEDWLVLYKSGKYPRPEKIGRITWEESASELLSKLEIGVDTRSKLEKDYAR